MASKFRIWHIEVPERPVANDDPFPALTDHISSPAHNDQSHMVDWVRMVYGCEPVVVKEATDYTR